MVFLGFDIGGTKCAVSLGESKAGEARILVRRELATPPGWREAVDVMFGIADEMLEGSGAERPAAVGFSCGSPLDAARGVIQAPPNLPNWVDVPITRMASERFGLPSFLENDANACALAEWRWGAGRGVDNMVFLTFGTGMGAGLILDGRLYRGASGDAGEVGHMRLASFGPAGYGKEGSFEGFCSGGGIAQLAELFARRAVQRGETPAYWQSGISPTAKSVADAARAGDETAREVIAYCAAKLGSGLSIIVDVLNPNRIVIGSIYSRCEDLFAEAVRAVIDSECLPSTAPVVSVVPAQLGDGIGDYAALCVAEYGMSHRP